MQLKLFLNKILKVDNIEGYTLGTLTELKKSYSDFLEMSGGSDPDFPMLSLGKDNKLNSTENFSRSNNIKHIDEIMNEEETMNNIPFPEESFNLTR